MTKALDRGAIGIHVNLEHYCYVEGQAKALEVAAKLHAANMNATITAEDYRGRIYDYDNENGAFKLRCGSISSMLGLKPCDDDSTFKRTSISEKRVYERYIVCTKAFGDNRVRGEIAVVDYYDERPDFLALVGTEFVPSIIIQDNTIAKFEGEELRSLEFFNNEFFHELKAADTFEEAEQRLIRWTVGHGGKIERDRAVE